MTERELMFAFAEVVARTGRSLHPREYQRMRKVLGDLTEEEEAILATQRRAREREEEQYREELRRLSAVADERIVMAQPAGRSGGLFQPLPEETEGGVHAKETEEEYMTPDNQLRWWCIRTHAGDTYVWPTFAVQAEDEQSARKAAWEINMLNEQLPASWKLTVVSVDPLEGV